MNSDVNRAWLGQAARGIVPSSTWHLLHELPIVDSGCQREHTGCVWVALPSWAEDLGVGSPAALLVPEHCVVPGDSAKWQRCDWWRGAFELCTCQGEKAYEKVHGPVHSYACRLPNRLAQYFDRAWVNRIVLFLRRWWAVANESDEGRVFGPVPPPRIHLTHDVDAVAKTIPVRGKQFAFCLLNSARHLVRAQYRAAFVEYQTAARFGLKGGDYWCFEKIDRLEASHGRRSTFNFYVRPNGTRSPKQWLLDPSYDIRRPEISSEIRQLDEKGHSIGLHQAFSSWRDSARMLTEKAALETVLRKPIAQCRQHWLRFSFADTWRAQCQAGFRLDTTLGFNDRPGFRAAAALRLPLLASDRGIDAVPGHQFEAVPMVLMDSHLRDYGLLEIEERRETIDNIVDELRICGGEASVIWHQRVFHPDYGWDGDYDYLLTRLDMIGAETVTEKL